jgi:glycosyltransferase involved in cell wall biosynthesis
VNDASPDGCPEILREYAAKDKRVRVFHHEKNAGIAAARNTGLDAATGEYIAFCDSDDYIQPDMFKIMYKEIRRNNCDLAICHPYLTKENNEPIFRKTTSYGIRLRNKIIQKYKKGSFIVVWSKLYKRSAIEKIRFDPEVFGMDDGDFNLRAANNIKRYVRVDARMYGWRQYANSSGKSESFTKKRIEASYRWIEKINNSSQDLVPLSSDQRCILSSSVAAIMAAETMVFCAQEMASVSRRISDFYSRGIIDLKHTRGISRKIVIALFLVAGKIQKMIGIL